MRHLFGTCRNQQLYESSPMAAELIQVADAFRAWVVRDLETLAAEERQSFRGDYLFVIDAKPSFLVVVTPESVSSARLEEWSGLEGLVCDLGAPLSLMQPELLSLLEGGARVRIDTDANTLQRLLAGTLKARVAYLNGFVKIKGDLPCFMRLVGLLKGRGVGPMPNARPDV